MLSLIQHLIRVQVFKQKLTNCVLNQFNICLYF